MLTSTLADREQRKSDLLKRIGEARNKAMRLPDEAVALATLEDIPKYA
jgi:DNA-binding Xre family transcriptional regulator